MPENNSAQQLWEKFNEHRLEISQEVGKVKGQVKSYGEDIGDLKKSTDRLRDDLGSKPHPDHPSVFSTLQSHGSFIGRGKWLLGVIGTAVATALVGMAISAFVDFSPDPPPREETKQSER